MKNCLLRHRIPVLYLAALLILVSPAFGQELTFRADPSKSQVDFVLGDVLHTVHGTFRLKESSIQINPVNGTAGGVVVVDASSGNTGSEARDHKMHKEVLESAKYPEIRFAVQSMQGSLSSTGNSEVKLSGIMSIHGADHPLTVTVPVQIGDGKATADIRFVVPYVQWGLKDPSTFVLRVSKEVEITVHIAGSIAPALKS